MTQYVLPLSALHDDKNGSAIQGYNHISGGRGIEVTPRMLKRSKIIIILLCELGLFIAFRSIIKKAGEIRLYDNNSLRLTKFHHGL